MTLEDSIHKKRDNKGVNIKQVLITDEASVNHHIYKGIRSYPKSPETLGTTIQSSIGGVFLSYDMLQAVSQQYPKKPICIATCIKRPKIEDVNPVDELTARRSRGKK